MPSNHAESSKPVWDRAGALARIQDEALLRLVCETFDRDAPRLQTRVRESLDGGRPAEAVVSAHALKASAANAGAERCRALAGDMERLAKAGDGVALRAILSSFDHARQRFRAALIAAGWSGADVGGPA